MDFEVSDTPYVHSSSAFGGYNNIAAVLVHNDAFRKSVFGSTKVWWETRPTETHTPWLARWFEIENKSILFNISMHTTEYVKSETPS